MFQRRTAQSALQQFFFLLDNELLLTAKIGYVWVQMKCNQNLIEQILYDYLFVSYASLPIQYGMITIR